eukprot:XP_763521.1 hypothetical protein [Theileria parva strain Muguga]
MDEDRRIDMLMRSESLHLYWYVEVESNFSNLMVHKRLDDQLGNADVLVCNFRPTDEMRQEIEQVEKKTNQKEDFETTKPAIKLEGTSNFIISCSDSYLTSMGLEPDESLNQYRSLKQKWQLERENKLKLHQLYNFSIYDYPSFIQWKLNNIQVTFKMYDPLQLLSTWKNCSNSVIHINDGDLNGDGAENASLVENNSVESNLDSSVKSVDLVVDLRMPCKHVLRYVSWLFGVDPCHVLIFSGNPQNFETIGSHLYSLDDFSNRDNSLGYTQKPLIHLFTIQGNLVMPNNLNLYHNPASARLSQRLSQSLSYDPTVHPENAENADNSDQADELDNVMDEDYDLDEEYDDDGYGRRTGRYNLRRLSAFRRSQTHEENVIHLGMLFEPYYKWNFKFDQESANVVAQLFNEKAQVISALMFKVPIKFTVAQLCKVVSNYYNKALNPNNKVKHSVDPTKIESKIETKNEHPAFLLVDVITCVYSIVDMDTNVLDLPQYNNNSVRNLFSAPLRFVPNWAPEQYELIQQNKLCPLTVFHQTPDHEYFGHPFQVLVAPTWNFLQIKTHIKNTLEVPKKLWDRWTFYQVTESHARSWKSNDDFLDWDNPNIKLLAEHPKPYEKSKTFGIMKIT